MRRNKWFGISALLIIALLITALPLTALLLTTNAGGWMLSGSRVDESLADYLAGDLSSALAKLSDSSSSEDVAALLLAARCHLQLGQAALFEQKVEQARALPGSTEQVELAMALYRIQRGQLQGSPQEWVDILLDAGALDSDARSAVVQGAFANSRFEAAQSLLEDWRRQHPDAAQLEYLSAVYLNITGRSDAAEAKFIDTLVHHPRHELSWLALVDLYSRPPDVRFEQAEAVLARFVHVFPDNAEGPVRLSKTRRRLGRVDETPWKLSGEPSSAESLELAQVAFDLGHYRDSLERFAATQLATPDDFNELTDRAFQLTLQGSEEVADELAQRVSRGATALALHGDAAAAAEIFQLASDRTARLRRLQDLNVLRTIRPNAQELIDELNGIVSPAFTPNYPTLQELDGSPQDIPLAGWPLYQAHCASCHGKRGAGDGYAASNLFPAPRSFTAEPMRMVSATNRLATDADLKRTIRQGQAGTSMPAFTQFSELELEQLIEVVRELMRRGLEQQFARKLGSGSEVAPEQQARWLQARLEPQGTLKDTPLEFAVDQAERGRQLFHRVGCASCHTVHGQPANALRYHHDSLGRPLVAPDLAIDPLHAGREPSALYHRIALGIPGTPHPALAAGDDQEVESLVAYLLSIGPEPKASTTNYARRLEALRLRSAR